MARRTAPALSCFDARPRDARPCRALRLAALVGAAIALGGAPGCVAADLGTEEGFREALPWIEVSRTPRAELIARLGTPHMECESGHLAAWRLGTGLTGADVEPYPLRENMYRRQDRWGDVRYWSLVVRFDESGRAARVGAVAHR
ncbi:MAG: hypothetical protein K8T90_02900 [Planctomycetes bacterium]|nr:hypothetical protein [Planctomycetota bacterium]